MHLFPYEWYFRDGYPAKNIEKNNLKVFSCFSCGGGSTMGYKLAGYDVIGFNEIDEKIAKVYIENHHPKYAYIESIRDFKLREDLPQELYNLDILDGSPPCSSFSLIGNREDDWGKEKKFKEGQCNQILDTLFFDFIDVVNKLQPKVVLAENVKGLILGKAQEYVKKIIKQFRESGYHVEYKLLSSNIMGVPQNRERVFFIAIRNDFFKYCVDKKSLFNDRLPDSFYYFNESKILFKEIINSGEGKQIQESLNNAYDFCLKNNISDFAKYYELTEHKRKRFNTILIFPDKVCSTITSTCEHVIANEKRFINKIELLKASTFPLDYNFLNVKEDYLCGMSVPPVMTAQIANRIKKYIFDKIK